MSTSTVVSTRPLDWWANAVIYQIYIRSFADSNGDGIGDLAGIINKLDYIEQLGVDALWITPFFNSPMADHGYDITDHRSVDPLYGNLEIFDELIAQTRQKNIQIMIDMVFNHTSNQHPWFTQALGEAPGSASRARYFFRDGKGPNGDEPPNNWLSIFGGSAWTRITEPDGSPGQWYLHLFAPEQPDLNWDNPEIIADAEQSLRFWMDRGVTGFRVDFGLGMAKDPDLPDMKHPRTEPPVFPSDDEDLYDPRMGLPAVHDIHRKIRTILNDYPGSIAVGEMTIYKTDVLRQYIRDDELHAAFNFQMISVPWRRDKLITAIDHGFDLVSGTSADTCWCLANHDLPRIPTRLGHDLVGQRRARAIALMILALPGMVFIYNGDELGLPDFEPLDEQRQDPRWHNSHHEVIGRDGCRTPLPWAGTHPPFGFTADTATPWLPQPSAWAPLTAQAQDGRPDSMLTLYRAAIALRHTHQAFEGKFEWVNSTESDFAFRRTGGLTCQINPTNRPLPLRPGAVLLSSVPLEDSTHIPGDCTVWLAN